MALCGHTGLLLLLALHCVATERITEPHYREQQDTLSQHMHRLYHKYNTAGFHFKDGNTVRSFKAHWGAINGQHVQMFNLSSLSKSERILSATLHYYTWGAPCAGSTACAPRRGTRRPVHLTMWSFAPVDNSSKVVGHLRLNVSRPSSDVQSWQWKDVTRGVNQAKAQGQMLLGLDLDTEGHGSRAQEPMENRTPYILVFANDSSVSQAEEVASNVRSLQRLQVERRQRRSAHILLPLQNNELPGPEYPYGTATWGQGEGEEEPGSPYEPPEGKATKRGRKKPRKSNRNGTPLLRFDEQTLRKARKKQWDEPRNCARRYLKVDFADIGWSEWIISPKSFDAYYCSGSCQFPMPKSLRPSNHATIQSIVRAVGVVPGIPEPCCVPEKMSSLSILFFDEAKNVVLKVYPNMTVDSCACR